MFHKLWLFYVKHFTTYIPWTVIESSESYRPQKVMLSNWFVVRIYTVPYVLEELQHVLLKEEWGLFRRVIPLSENDYDYLVK